MNPLLPLCLQITPHIDPRFGGVAASVPALADALAATGRYRSLVGAFRGARETLPAGLNSPFQLFPFGRKQWLTDRSLGHRLRELVDSADALHIHGIWQEHCALSAGAARERKKPYLVSAHGMLEPWALRQRAWKKRAYAFLSERGNLNRAHALRALTAAEATHYRQFGLTIPIAIIPNGIRIPESADPGEFWRKFPELRGKRLLLFLGRLHPKKGVDPLCRSWAALARQMKDGHLVFAGPDSDETPGFAARLVEELGIGQRVSFTGMLAGDLKWSALAACSLFVLPSYSEGFSVATLEALAMGKPVIISHPCYFPEVARAGCGWTIEPTETALRGALAEAFEASDVNLTEMGERGRQLAKKRYQWDVVAGQMADLLDWILGGTPPATFELVR